MKFPPSIIIPYLSIISLFFYYLTYDMIINPSFKIGRDFLFFILISLHLGFLLYEKQKKQSSPAANFGIAISTIISFCSYVLRNYLDLPVRPGMPLESSPIPKIRDFLLIIIILSALYSFIYQILLSLSRDSIQAQSRLGENKRNLLQNTAYNFLIIFPLLIAVNFFSSAKNYNFDLSSIGKFSYSETSRSILKQIDKKISVTAFYPRPLEASGKEESWALSAVRMEIAIYLEQLSAINPRIEVRFINADVERDLLGEFDQVSNGMVVFRTLKSGSSFGGSPYLEEKILVQNKKDLEDLERKVVQAINNLSSPSKTIYFTTSNGEHYSEKYSNILDGKITKLTNSLTFFNYQIKELGFKELWAPKIPQDADMLAIIGPETEFSEEAQKSILDYLIDKNGKVFITIDPKSKENFKWLTELSSFNFEIGDLRQVQGRPEIIANNFPEHPISNLFIKKEIGAVFSNSGYFEKLNSRVDLKFKESILLESGFTTFLDNNSNSKLDDNEKQNSFILGVALTVDKNGENKEEAGKVIIYSGTDWITDRYFLYNLNPALAGNSFNWLHQKQIIDSILTKKEDTPIITLTQNQKLFIWSVGLFGYPLSIILGLSLYVNSRRKN